jgi:hypothetical protein
MLGFGPLVAPRAYALANKTPTGGAGSYLDGGATVTTTPLTMAAWIFRLRTSLGGTNDTIIGVHNTASATLRDCHLLQLATQAGGIAATTGAASASAQATGPWNISHSRWTHVAGVWASATSRIVYIDGVAGTANATSRAPSGINSTTIGCEHASTIGLPWGGGIAQVGIWNAALTQSDLALLAAGASPRYIKTANLVAYYPLTAQIPPGIDLSGDGNKLALVGGIWTLPGPPIFGRHSPYLVKLAVAPSVIQRRSLGQRIGSRQHS